VTTLEELRQSLPEAAKDIKLNLEAVLTESSLSEAQRWGTAVASAIATRNPTLVKATYDAAKQMISAEVIDDAIAAASLMAMNNVYYRGKHMLGDEAYAKKPARLRMNRIARPASEKLNFELFALAVSAINSCESCVRAHVNGVTKLGLNEDQIHDSLRIAATFQGVAVALEAAALLPPPVAAAA
jgi:alkyl hydroperoxide reductase subunit D